jgi:hypothetical protein
MAVANVKDIRFILRICSFNYNDDKTVVLFFFFIFRERNPNLPTGQLLRSPNWWMSNSFSPTKQTGKFSFRSKNKGHQEM